MIPVLVVAERNTKDATAGSLVNRYWLFVIVNRYSLLVIRKSESKRKQRDE